MALALYGNLAGKTEMDEVEIPVVSVESFRVFSAKKQEMQRQICRCILR